MYAPCSMKLLYYWTAYASGNMQVWESINPVHLPNGAVDYLTLMVAHANYPPITTTGSTVNQGDHFYNTGTYGQVTGDHCHTCIGQGHYQGFTVRQPGGHEDLTNRIHYWDGVYVNDTTIVQGFNHNWVIWDVPVPPTPTSIEFNKFPWVLYARKFRNRRS